MDYRLISLILLFSVFVSSASADTGAENEKVLQNETSEADNLLIIEVDTGEEAAAAEAEWPHQLTLTIKVENFSAFGDADIYIPGYTSQSCGHDKSARLRDVMSWTIEETLIESGIFGNVFTETDGDLLLFGQVANLKKKGFLRKGREVEVALQLYDRVQKEELWKGEYTVPFNLEPMEKRIAGDINYKYSLPFPELTTEFMQDLNSFLLQEREGALKKYLNRWIFSITVGDLYFVATNRLDEPVEVRISMSDNRTYFMDLPAAPGKTQGDASQVCKRVENQYGFFEAELFALGNTCTIERFLFEAPKPKQISYIIDRNDAGEVFILVE